MGPNTTTYACARTFKTLYRITNHERVLWEQAPYIYGDLRNAYDFEFDDQTPVEAMGTSLVMQGELGLLANGK
jgi:hypothetical protein